MMAMQKLDDGCNEARSQDVGCSDTQFADRRIRQVFYFLDALFQLINTARLCCSNAAP